LAALAQCSPESAWSNPFHFQTFDDKKSKARTYAKHWSQSIDEGAENLENLNTKGAGVFISVNATDGKGRKKANITDLRGWHCDIDTKDAKNPFDLNRPPLAPTMAVRTPGGWHLYWLATAPMPCDGQSRWEEHEAELKAIQAALSPYGADPKACTVERVLRVPGFLHQKADPLLVELINANGPRYTRDQILQAFQPVLEKSMGQTRKRSKAPPSTLAYERVEVIERAGRYLETIPASIAGDGGNAEGGTKTFNDALKLISGFDLTEDEALSLLCERYNPRCQPEWTLDELRHKVHDSWAVAQESHNRGHLLEDQGRPWVPGFMWEERGLIHLKHTTDQDEGGHVRPKRILIAPPFTLNGLVRDGVSHGWRLLISWHDPDGVHHEEGLPFELLSGEGAELARVLGQGGLMLSPEPGLRRLLLRYLSIAASRIRTRVRLIDTLGWHEGAFVLPGGEIIGEATEPVRYAGEIHGAGQKAVHGTFEAWKTEVAALAVGNPRLAFSFATAFAGPLMAVIRPDGGGGFNLMGSSSKGKSTCLEAAASVWGKPDPLITWRATGNGLEGLAAARNDGFLPLDELSQIDSKEAGHAAYLLANGSAKARMTREGENRSMKQWRLIFLSSGEQGLEEKVGEDGKRVRAGQEVRVPDIPCPVEGMFEHSHGMGGFGEFAEKLKSGARKNYGHAARIFIRCLCEKSEEGGALASKLHDQEATWMAKAIPARADGQVRRVAGRFALVALAGELAREFAVLPWPEGEASRAALVCFKAWLERRGHIGASERERGLRAVVDFVSQHGISRFAPWDEPDAKTPNMAGVRKISLGKELTSKFGKSKEREGWDFYFTPTGWKEACKGFDSATVARDAVEEGLLEPGPGGKPYRKERTPHGQGQWYVIRAAALGSFRSEDVA
jgi:uncharacterized protein (DUF927 family)